MNIAKQDVILEVAKTIKDKGYRVFIAKSGTYGFYTTQDGLKVVSFQYYFGGACVSGHYKTDKPRVTGNGWRITDNFTVEEIDTYMSEVAPLWAVGNAKVHYITSDEYLTQYQASSQYTEI